MSIKVVAFNGSPKKDGNTVALIQTVLQELAKENIQTEIIHVGDKLIQGCAACKLCWKNRNQQCVLKSDQVNEWLTKMFEADAIILGSSVQFANLTGPMKSFLDRAFMVAIANDYMFKRKVGASVMAVRRAGAVTTMNALNAYFTIAQMIVVGSSYWNMGFGLEPGEALQDAEGLQTMSNLGKNMAWLLQLVAAGEK